jgi:hypothetical protein
MCTTQANTDTEDLDNPSLGSEFDQYCLTLVAKDDDEGWATELWRYLNKA